MGKGTSSEHVVLNDGNPANADKRLLEFNFINSNLVVCNNFEEFIPFVRYQLI